MKKILLSAVIITASLSANAQKVTKLSSSLSPELYGMAISENGKFLGGSDNESRAFIYNTETGIIKFYGHNTTGDESYTVDSDLRDINNDGVGVGYVAEVATKFDFNTGAQTAIDETTNESSLAKYISADGSIVSYMTYGNTYNQTPYWKKDGVAHKLQTTSDDWIGYETNGFVVEKGNADGSVLMGYAVDNFATNPLFIWVKNHNEDTYSIIQLSRRFFDGSYEWNQPQPCDVFTGGAISANGRWVAINWHNKNDFDGGEKVARYDLTTDSITFLDCPADSYIASGITDDGTIVGFYGDWTRNGFICKAGETEVKNLADAFPNSAEIAEMESNGNTVTDITSDGRYILGFTDEYVDDIPSVVTYVIDTKDSETSIKSATDNSNNSIVASYTVDGKRANATNRGVMINKMSSGIVKKSIRK